MSGVSEGNGQGVGVADVVTAGLVAPVDPVATYVNNIVSTFLERAFIPIAMPTDRDAVAAALASLGLPDPARARMGRIRNTLHLEQMWLSESVLPGLAGREDVAVGVPAVARVPKDGLGAGLRVHV